MHLTLIKNDDQSQMIVYKLARIVYAETGGASLTAAEALTSMIGNLHRKSNLSFADIAEDKKIFPALATKSPKLFINADDPGFQMCLRVMRQMFAGILADSVSNATRFHHDGHIPQWASSVGYIAEIGGMLFYI